MADVKKGVLLKVVPGVLLASTNVISRSDPWRVRTEKREGALHENSRTGLSVPGSRKGERDQQKGG